MKTAGLLGALETSQRPLIALVRSTGQVTLTPITASRCFIDAVNTRAIPAPLDPALFSRVGSS